MTEEFNVSPHMRGKVREETPDQRTFREKIDAAAKRRSLKVQGGYINGLGLFVPE